MNVSLENFPKQSRKSDLVEVVRGDGDHCGVELFLSPDACLALMPLHGQKGERGHDSNSLVSVKIGLGFSQMKSVGCRHVKVTSTSTSVKKSVLSGCECRFNKTGISDSRRSAMIFQARRVRQVHLFQSQKHKDLLGKFLEKMGMVFAHLIGCVFEGKTRLTHIFKITEAASYVFKCCPQSSRFVLSLHNLVVQSRKLFLRHFIGHAIFLSNHRLRLPEFLSPSSRFPNPTSAS